jgi:hypothetical protein
VQARGASEIATSEECRQKAQIEANGDVTQAEERQEDKTHAPDSAGGNRTQW